MFRFRRLLSIALSLFMLIGSLGVSNVFAYSGTITCESFGGRYNYCRVNTDNYVYIERRISFNGCIYGRDWGYDRRGIWVDHGCRAEFRYGKSGGGSTAPVAAGAVLGGLILAGALASKDKKTETDHDGWKDGSSHVSSYFVGTFRGWNPNRNELNDITIAPDGAVTVRSTNGDYHEFGTFSDRTLALPWGVFEVEKEDGGILAKGRGDDEYKFVRVR